MLVKKKTKTMGIDINKFEQIKNKARKMIAEDAKKDSAIIKARTADRNNPKFYSDQPSDAYSKISSFNNSSQQNINESYYDDNNDALYNAMDNKMKQFVEGRQQQPQYVQQTPVQINKGLPKEILESFSNNYIDQSAFDPNMPILDKMGITGDNIQQQQEQKQISNGKVDYELIKSIVESTVKKYINALGKKMLNENKTSDDTNIKAVQFTGDKFVFVTKGGDLYEAKMTYIKNVNKK